MTPNIPFGAAEFVTVSAYVVIFTFFWRMLAARLGDTTLGRAMLAVYS